MSLNRLRVLAPLIRGRNASRLATRSHTLLHSNSETTVIAQESYHGVKFPKKMVAMLIGYNGLKYQGMQIQPEVKTIEGDLFSALIKAGAVSTANSISLQKISFGRTSRTDKGVHAAMQLVNFKLIQGVDISKLNAELPEEIRAFGFLQVPHSFNARSACDSRHYEYMLPTYALGGSIVAPSIPHDGVTRPQYIPSLEELDEQRRYRSSPETLERMREILGCYIGKHNFYNFTKGKQFSDPSCYRHMISIKVSDPTVINGMEWVHIKIYGHSFMLNQIRKMVGLMVLMVRKNIPSSFVNRAYGKTPFILPIAPANGLFLDKPVFTGYNMKLERLSRRPITFDTFEDKVQAFKENIIYRSIIQEEMNNSFWGDFLYKAIVYESNWVNFDSPRTTASEECILE